MYKCLYEHLLFFLCYICGRRMTEPCRYFLASWGFPGHFRTIIPNFIFSSTMCEYQYSHILSTAILTCMKWCLRLCFHFPDSEKCWLFFIHLFGTICTFSLERYLFKLLANFKILLSFLLLSSKHSFYIQGVSSSSNTPFKKHFSHSVGP